MAKFSPRGLYGEQELAEENSLSYHAKDRNWPLAKAVGFSAIGFIVLLIWALHQVASSH